MQAQREGLPEIAEALKSIAMDEVWHAARFAELNGLISESTKENLEKMLVGEQGANKGKRAAALKAKEIGIDEAHSLIRTQLGAFVCHLNVQRHISSGKDNNNSWAAAAIHKTF